MISSIVAALQAELRVQECPIPVVRRDERQTAQTYGRERIVVELGGNDRFTAGRGGAALGSARRAVLFRQVAVSVKIYVRDPRPGASVDEHRERAAKVIDTLVPAFDKVLRGQHKTTWSLDGGSYFTPPDLEASEHVAGAAYELRLSVERGIYGATWKGEGPVTASVGGVGGVGIHNTTRVSMDGDDFEVSCGG